MLDYILRFIITGLIIAGIAFLIPTLIIFFLQVLVAVSVFLVVLCVFSCLGKLSSYRGNKDE